jgi:uncharacterized protein YdhG (YjbR/CyaY superfamily)
VAKTLKFSGKKIVDRHYGEAQSVFKLQPNYPGYRLTQQFIRELSTNDKHAGFSPETWLPIETFNRKSLQTAMVDAVYHIQRELAFESFHLVLVVEGKE